MMQRPCRTLEIGKILVLVCATLVQMMIGALRMAPVLMKWLLLSKTHSHLMSSRIVEEDGRVHLGAVVASWLQLDAEEVAQFFDP
jgi:hypothetical protein